MIHSTFSASAAERWMACPGSVVLSDGLPDSTSKYAAEGTVAHAVLTDALNNKVPAATYLGEEREADGFTFTVDETMVEAVQVTVDYVNGLLAAPGAYLMVDERVNYATYLGVAEEQGFGTLDTTVIDGTRITVVDFKYGRGVRVEAGGNPQLKLYGLGALSAFHNVVETFTEVVCVISQPRVSTEPSIHTYTVDELEVWGHNTARSAASSVQVAADARGVVPSPTWEETFLRPSEDACRWCKAKATCPSARQAVSSIVFAGEPMTPDEFGAAEPRPIEGTDDAWLAATLSRVDLIEGWCSAVRAEVERRLLAGSPVPGYKIVQGRRGARQWTDAKEAEEMLKSFRLKVDKMYDLKLISPTAAEKLAKAGDIGPHQWKKAAALISQSDGKAHVAPVSDPRPAVDITPVVEEFDVVTDPDELA